MKTSKGSPKKGRGRTTDMKNIDVETLRGNCGYNENPVEGHNVIPIGINLNGRQMYYCLSCGHIIGAKL
jgi:hypothetical protein